MVIISDVNTPHQWYTIPPSWSCKWQCMWSLALWWFTIFSSYANSAYSLILFGPMLLWAYFLTNICSMQKCKNQLQTFLFDRKKKWWEKMKKKCCLWFSFINPNYSLQPMYLIGEEVQSEICKCILLMFGSCIKCTLIASSSYIDHNMITTRIS